MTREEAIKILKELPNSILGVVLPFDTDFDYIQALDIAIRVLEQQPSEDAVSRKDVINYIRTLSCDLSYWSVTDEVVKDIDDLPPVTPTQRWIPCSERLPNNHEYMKNNGLFNVSDGNRSYSEYFDIYDTERFGEPTMNGFRVDRCVIAWMPLSEPYKTEMENNK